VRRLFVPLAVLLADGRLAARAGCNHLGGAPDLDDGRLRRSAGAQAATGNRLDQQVSRGVDSGWHAPRQDAWHAATCPLP
jgi:hypothetical protein